MIEFLKKHNKIVYIVLSSLCVIVGFVTKQWYIYLSAIVLFLMGLGILNVEENKDDENKKE